jgi:hypothetical protein
VRFSILGAERLDDVAPAGLNVVVSEADREPQSCHGFPCAKLSRRRRILASSLTFLTEIAGPYVSAFVVSSRRLAPSLKSRAAQASISFREKFCGSRFQTFGS